MAVAEAAPYSTANPGLPQCINKHLMPNKQTETFHQFRFSTNTES
jgi:hypothetical protein